MKRMLYLIQGVFALIILPGLGFKTGSDDATGEVDQLRLASMEYAGLALVGDDHSLHPLSIRFGDNGDVSAWSNLLPGKYNRDVEGKVTKVEGNAQGETVLTVTWQLPDKHAFHEPQVYTISADKRFISGGTSPLYVLNDLPLYRECAQTNLALRTRPAHPDWLAGGNDIIFLQDGKTVYRQVGQTFFADPTIPARPSLLLQHYNQDGCRISFMAAFDDPSSPLLCLKPYYGVLSENGTVLYLDALE